MTVRVRFAPSPTGRLHVGNVRTALVNWLYARAHGGVFVLRLDDTDSERSTQAFADGIETDLTWLGLGWDDFMRQSDRFDRYDAAAAALRASGRLYPCYETAEELDLKRKLQLAQRKPPVYDRAALKLTDADRAAYEAKGLKPHWRFKLDEGSRVTWRDLVHGEPSVDMQSLSDPVLIRADGTYLYTLPSVLDDIDLSITHVMRGEDHVTNTAVQIQIFEALGAKVPAFAHFSLLTGAEGEGLSKRTGALSVAEMREDGIEAMAILSLLARLGTADPVEPRVSHADLIAGFDVSRFGRSAAKFDPEELRNLNAKLLHVLPFESVAGELRALGLEAADEAFWAVVRPNLKTIKDARVWWQVVEGPLTPVVSDADFMRTAADLLPPEPWDSETWKQWTTAVKDKTGAKGKALFLPLRLALTGLEHGPELNVLLPLIGRKRALERLS
ncbi:glutamate--tRNA ligase [Govanella unica]|uniref:Glutamate--tRNA ligase n=1 Tax=Govanella unica TaxID=2975056 RepID=A0A9X3TXS1_9PROT|nr:glutamate--tRNA ligase [Govania unica]MDA5193632.1 glutamate--tRNA ligase [Govania unica]